MANRKKRDPTKQLRIVGKTEDGKIVLAGVFDSYASRGFPFDASFALCEQNNAVPDWTDFYEQAVRSGWTFKAIKLRIEHPLIDTWGQEFCNVVLERLEKFENP